MTVQELRLFIKNAGDICEICGISGEQTKGGLCIDHDHKNGTTRGLLCANCNYMLGHANDNSKILNKAIDYLDKYKDRDAQFAIGGILLENIELQESFRELDNTTTITI